MLWRTFRSNCERLYRWNQEKFWQLTRTNVDPQIPNLPLETPSGGGMTYFQSVSGSLSFTGGIAKKPMHLLTGQTSFTGSIAKKPMRILAGSVSFAGSITKKTMRIFSVTPLPFSGAFSKKTIKPFTASVNFDGNFLKKIFKPLDGTLLFAGSLFMRTLRALLAAGLTFSGALSTLLIHGTVEKKSRKRKSLLALPEEVYQWLM